ncbi:MULTISPECIES: hypothetical protein [Bacillaceae]|uniref:hypothetical protein n=1 Tax=Shouchella oshimensis TaxID=290588 RepID=UPI000A539ECF|nr:MULTISPECIES: hypothetical protein [Bacillaceae]
MAITSFIPKAGPLAAGFATVWIQYNIKVGYFKRSIGTRADTDARYRWQQANENQFL